MSSVQVTPDMQHLTLRFFVARHPWHTPPNTQQEANREVRTSTRHYITISDPSPVLRISLQPIELTLALPFLSKHHHAHHPPSDCRACISPHNERDCTSGSCKPSSPEAGSCGAPTPAPAADNGKIECRFGHRKTSVGLDLSTSVGLDLATEKQGHLKLTQCTVTPHSRKNPAHSSGLQMVYSASTLGERPFACCELAWCRHHALSSTVVSHAAFLPAG